jgi:hypothetical protein
MLRSQKLEDVRCLVLNDTAVHMVYAIEGVE